MEDSRLTPRKRRILKAIVDAHINHGEPVGSKYIAQDMKITCSSATIRNEMANLEELGYLDKPHTSAGRVPSSKGYRLYVDNIMKESKKTVELLIPYNEQGLVSNIYNEYTVECYDPIYHKKIYYKSGNYYKTSHHKAIGFVN